MPKSNMKIIVGCIILFIVSLFWLLINQERCYMPISKSLKTLAEIKALYVAVEKHHSEYGNLPSSLKELSPKYIRNFPEEIWGNGFVYEVQSSTNFTVYSLGADGLKGGVGISADIYINSNSTEMVNNILKPVWGCNE